MVSRKVQSCLSGIDGGRFMMFYLPLGIDGGRFMVFNVPSGIGDVDLEYSI